MRSVYLVKTFHNQNKNMRCLTIKIINTDLLTILNCNFVYEICIITLQTISKLNFTVFQKVRNLSYSVKNLIIFIVFFTKNLIQSCYKS